MTFLTSAEELEVSSAAKKIRVQLDFEPDDFATINLLKREMGLGTRAELFRSALRVLRWMFQKHQQGCTIVAITPENRFIEPEFDFMHKLPDEAHVKNRDVKARKAVGKRA